MLRPALFALVVSFGVLGVASAKPDPKPSSSQEKRQLQKLRKLNPVWAKQLKTTKLQKPVEVLQEKLPDFSKLQRMTIEDKAAALEADETAISGPIRLTARQPYVDDSHYVEFFGNGATVSYRTERDYVHLHTTNPSIKPRVRLVLRAAPNKRYLVECAVEGQTGGADTISATDYNVTYSVQGDARATLLFVVAPKPTERKVEIDITSTGAWYYDGCEISWS
jgi:hypothetical protein